MPLTVLSVAYPLVAARDRLLTRAALGRHNVRHGDDAAFLLHRAGAFV